MAVGGGSLCEGGSDRGDAYSSPRTLPGKPSCGQRMGGEDQGIFGRVSGKKPSGINRDRNLDSFGLFFGQNLRPSGRGFPDFSSSGGGLGETPLHLPSSFTTEGEPMDPEATERRNQRHLPLLTHIPVGGKGGSLFSAAEAGTDDPGSDAQGTEGHHSSGRSIGRVDRPVSVFDYGLIPPLAPCPFLVR
ncbi:hypothetical protein CULT_70049 [[Clostridium] ultunense Esp]|nr:hypothetical protein CULT_70049 [[Clostridium] ultunense Esp]